MRPISDSPLWLGHVGDVRDLAALLSRGILAVVDLALDEPPAKLPREIAYFRVPLIDGEGNPPWRLRMAVSTVAHLLRSGVPTLVCCGAGLSRTPAVAAAAIASVRECSLAEALAVAVGSGAADISPALWAEVEATFSRSSADGKEGDT